MLGEPSPAPEAAAPAAAAMEAPPPLEDGALEVPE